jgi:serine/threonine-protein kinase haspin
MKSITVVIDLINYCLSNRSPHLSLDLDAFDRKILRISQQKTLIDVYFILKKYSNIKQIEGGSYSFVYKAEDMFKRKIILKVQDVGMRSTDGQVDRNSETQFLVSDLINTQRLNELRLSTDRLNYCSNFAKLLAINYVYKMDKKHKNRREMVVTQQLFGGTNLWKCPKLKPEEALSIVSQVICSIAIAENAIEFEHRDLHPGNILIDRTDDQYIDYCLNGKCFQLKLHGYRVTIIDTTFSRSKVNNETIFNDLTDIVNCDNKQMKDCYTKQRQLNSFQWTEFCPKSNIFWLKLIMNRICQKLETESHVINDWKSNVLNYNSVLEFGEKFCKLYTLSDSSQEVRPKTRKCLCRRIYRNIKKRIIRLFH